jgi:TP901 family phage tail tape measure protein
MGLRNMARQADLKARIQLKGGEDFRRQLSELGQRGQRAFQALDNAAKGSRKSLRRIDQAVAQVRKRLAQAQRGAASLAKGLASVSTKAALLGGTAITGAAAGVFTLAKRSAEAADQLGKMSQALGISASTLAEYRFAAEQSGATQQQLDDSLRRFTRRLGLFTTEGAGAAANAFEQLGIKTRNSAGELRSSEAVLDDVFAALGQIESESELAARASQFFGERAGPALVPLLKQGEKGIADLRGEARALGLNFSQDQTKASAAFNDALGRLKAAFTGIANQIGQVFLPKLTKLAGALSDFLADNRQRLVDLVERGWQFLIDSALDFIALFREGGEAQTALQWTRAAYERFQAVRDTVADLAATGGRVFDALGSGVRSLTRTIDGLVASVRRIGQAFGDRGLFGGLAQGVFELTGPSLNKPVARVGPDGELLSRAEGGPIRGPGTGTSDSILARVSNGEYVLRAGAVQSIGEGMLDRLNAMGARALHRPAFADGGLVEAGGSETAGGGSPTNFDFSGATIVAPSPERFIDELNRYIDGGGDRRLRSNVVAPRGVR